MIWCFQWVKPKKFQNTALMADPVVAFVELWRGLAAGCSLLGASLPPPPNKGILPYKRASPLCLMSCIIKALGGKLIGPSAVHRIRGSRIGQKTCPKRCYRGDTAEGLLPPPKSKAWVKALRRTKSHGLPPPREVPPYNRRVGFNSVWQIKDRKS